MSKYCFLHFGYYEMYDYPCQHKRASANNKNDIVSGDNIANAFIKIKDVPNKKRKKYTTNSTRHTTQAHY